MPGPAMGRPAARGLLGPLSRALRPRQARLWRRAERAQRECSERVPQRRRLPWPTGSKPTGRAAVAAAAVVAVPRRRRGALPLGSKAREGRGGRSGPRRGGSGGGGGDRGAAGERGSGRGGANKPVPEGLYKTKMCYHFLGAGCVLGAECNFAHGEHELRGPAFSGCGPTRSPSPLSAGSGPGSPLGGGGGGRSGKARCWSGPGLNGGLAVKETAPAGAGGYSPDGLRTPERAAAPGRRGSGGGTPQPAWAGAAPCQPGHVSPTRTPPSGKGPPISGLKIAVAGGEDDSPDGKMSTPKWARELVGSAELS